jgi:hypothetical protein
MSLKRKEFGKYVSKQVSKQLTSLGRHIKKKKNKKMLNKKMLLLLAQVVSRYTPLKGGIGCTTDFGHPFWFVVCCWLEKMRV